MENQQIWFYYDVPGVSQQDHCLLFTEPEPPLRSDLWSTFPWENFSLSWFTGPRGTNKVRSLWVDPGEFLAGCSPLIHTLVCPQRFRPSPSAVGTGLQKAGPVRACTGIHALLPETGLCLSSAVPPDLLCHPSPTRLLFPPFYTLSLGTRESYKL